MASIVPSRSDPAEWAWPLSTTAGPPGGQGEAAESRSPGRSFYLGGDDRNYCSQFLSKINNDRNRSSHHVTVRQLCARLRGKVSPRVM